MIVSFAKKEFEETLNNFSSLVIFMDLTMPRLDGRSTVKQIRKMELKIQPFICATSSLISEGLSNDVENERNLCFEVNKLMKLLSNLSPTFFFFKGGL